MYEGGKGMIKEIVQKWEMNKDNLKSHFESLRKGDHSYFDLSYEDVVKAVVTHVINVDNGEGYRTTYSPDKMTVIDDGDYQGTQLFIIPEDTYQPSVEEYIFTYVNYGSCSGCDTMEHILSEGDYDDQRLNEQQIKDLMTLSLHIIQSFKKLEEKE